MKVFLLSVGDPIVGEILLDEENRLCMKCFNDGLEHMYMKKDVINFTTQMMSLIDSGLDLEYGLLTQRKSISALVKAGINLRRVIKEKKIELVHVHWGVTASLMAVMSSRVPVVISFCGSDLYGSVQRNGGKGLSAKVAGFMSQLSGLFASRIIVKSDEMLQNLWGPNKKKATVIANGVDTTLFSPVDQQVARKHLSWRMDKFYILFFTGGGSPVKDPALAHSAFSYVKQKIDGCELVLVENIPYEELVWYYNAADVLLITSLHEGSNNSLKEALSCNLPVVSVLCGDARERLAQVDSCRVVEERTPESIGKALLEIITAKRRSNARHFIEDLNLEHVAAKVIDVYRSALRGHGPRNG